MSNLKARTALRLAFLFAFLSFGAVGSGCGLEVLLLGLPTGGEHKAPEPAKITKIQGSAPGISNGSVSIRAGNAQIAQGKTDGSGGFDIELPAGTDFFNLTVEVQAGAALLKILVPSIPKGAPTTIDDVTIQSTTAALILEAALSARGLQTINYPQQALTSALGKLKTSLGSDAALKRFAAMVDAVHKAALKSSSDSALLQSPSYQAANDGKSAPTVTQSALKKDGLGAGIDYCAKDDIQGCTDGPETTTEAFDLALAQAVKAFTLPSCTYENELQVVITASLSPDAKDGNCSNINQFKHAKRYGGSSCKNCKVYFTGGVHKDSGIISPKVAQTLSNWEPNQVQMYDDGTNGDLVAGDGIWTLTLTLPAPEPTNKSCNGVSDCETGQACLQKKCHKVMRIGYKFTYGQQGDVWGGTEEFPGNQRILEIVDQNGDGFVARHDNFADETGNKDKVNTLQKKGATGLVCFREPAADQCQAPVPSKNHPDCGCKEDQDGDGIPDARERPWDSDNDCKPDGFRVYANVQPKIKSCQ